MNKPKFSSVFAQIFIPADIMSNIKLKASTKVKHIKKNINNFNLLSALFLAKIKPKN